MNHIGAIYTSLKRLHASLHIQFEACKHNLPAYIDWMVINLIKWMVIDLMLAIVLNFKCPFYAFEYKMCPSFSRIIILEDNRDKIIQK